MTNDLIKNKNHKEILCIFACYFPKPELPQVTQV